MEEAGQGARGEKTLVRMGRHARTGRAAVGAVLELPQSRQVMGTPAATGATAFSPASMEPRRGTEVEAEELANIAAHPVRVVTEV